MTYTKLIATFGIVAALAAVSPSSASAQQRRGQDRGQDRGGRQERGPAVVGRAVPRRGPAPRIIRPPIVRSAPYRPYYYRPGFNLGLTFGTPAYRYSTPYAYRPSYRNYGYGYVQGQAYGGVRIDLPQRNAQVFVDGYFTGIVNDFDGVLQHLDLTPGPHHIEVALDGYEPIAFDVNVQPGRTITYSADMYPARQ